MGIRVLVISDYRDFHSTRPEASIFLGLAKMGFEIIIMTSIEAKLVDEFKAVGIKVIDFQTEKKFNKTEIKRIREVLINEKIDVLHLFNSEASVNGILAAKGLDVKVVLYRGYAGHIHWWDPTAYFKYLNPRVDKIMCNSMGVEEVIQKQLFFDKTKTKTINKGHDVKWYEDYKPLDVRKELGLASDSFLLVTVGNNRKMKGIIYLIKAINLLPKNLPIHLLLVGRDMDSNEYKSLLKKEGKSDSVHFMGFRKDVLNIVAGCDVFVLPSIYGESITKSVIEAMSLGIAPIISSISGNKELVVDGESGLVFESKNSQELSDCIIKLYKDQSLSKKLGENARKRIKEHLNHEQTIQKVKALYEDLILN